MVFCPFQSRVLLWAVTYLGNAFLQDTNFCPGHREKQREKSWRWALFALFSLFLLFPAQPVVLSLPPQRSDRAGRCSACGICVRVRGGRRELFVSRDEWDPGASGSSVPLGMKTLRGQFHPLSPLVLSFRPQMSSRGLEVTKKEAYMYILFQPTTILNVKQYYSSFILASMWQNI